MSRLDFDAINARLDPATAVPSWLPEGKRRGREWIARNPTRADASPGSFTVNLTTGKWADFATDDKGGDLVSLYAYLFTDGDNGKAARELGADEAGRVPAAERQAVAERVTKLKEHQSRPVFPVPDHAPEPSFRHFRFGEPSAVWPYYNGKGRLLLYVCRYDHEGGKDIVPLSWVQQKGKPDRWKHKGVIGDKKRPLYGLDRLAAMPDAPVLLVEGEKTADAAHELVGHEMACISWLGGTSTADRVALGPLAGRFVTLWPDFDSKRRKPTGELLPDEDQPGNKAMLTIAKALAGVAATVSMVGYTVAGQFPDAWDLADAAAQGWGADNVHQYLELHAMDPLAVARSWGREEPEEPEGGEVETASSEGAAPVPLSANVNPFNFPYMTQKMRPLNAVENLEYLLGEYGIKCRYNQISKGVEISIPGRIYTADNEENCALAEINSLCARNQMPTATLDGYVKLIADKDSYNPAVEWICSEPWDGVSRIPEIMATVESTMPDDLKHSVIYRWLLSAVAAVFHPSGFSSHGALVFTGAQGLGKTRWVRALVPPELSSLVADGASIDPDNKDSVANVIGHWLVELGELDGTFRRADIAKLKSFITKPNDKIRLPYDRKQSNYQRRTVFFASVNADRYLVDDTGNRRWWTVPVVSVDYEHGINTQQLWAEMLTHYREGHQWWLTPEEQDAMNSMNADHEAVDPVEEMVLAAFDWNRPGMGEDMTASQVLVAIGQDRPTRQQATHATQLLVKLTGGKPRRAKNGRFFRMPPREYSGPGGGPF